MLVNVLIWLAVVAVAGGFVWLVRRALRLRNLAARWALALLVVMR